jgi:hypothetical protein
MTKEQFNKKYAKYLEERFYGLDIDIPELTDYLDTMFENHYTKIDGFQFSQIKSKFGFIRIYCNLAEGELRRLENACQTIWNKNAFQAILNNNKNNI